MNICLFGGTFNPIHLGHLNMAQIIIEDTDIDRFIFIPTGESYHKFNVISAKHRYEMTKLSVNDYFNQKPKCEIEVSDVEILRSGPSYSYETILYYKNLYKDSVIYFVIGEDSLNYINCWKNPEIIFNNSNLIVFGRNSQNNSLQSKADEISEKFNCKIKTYKFNYDISSTQIKEMINRDDQTYNQYITKSVINYIKENNLYK